jgi:hypothetical protein
MATATNKPKRLTAEQLTATFIIAARAHQTNPGRPFFLLVPTAADGTRIARMLRAAGFTSKASWYWSGGRGASGWYRFDIRGTNDRWAIEYSVTQQQAGCVNRVTAP